MRCSAAFTFTLVTIVLRRILHTSPVWDEILLWISGQWRTAVDGMYVPFEAVVTASFNPTLISHTHRDMLTFLFVTFCHILWSKGCDQFSYSQTLKPIGSQSQNTKYFDCALRIATDMANWNFVTSALWHHFEGHDHHFGIFKRNAAKLISSESVFA